MAAAAAAAAVRPHDVAQQRILGERWGQGAARCLSVVEDSSAE